MNTKHTPGPWKWDGQLSLFKIECSGGHIIDSAPYEGSWLSRYKPAEDEANARLIAAAPELLEALARIDQWPDEPIEDFRPDGAVYGEISVGEMKAIRAAIAKATGDAR